MAARNCHEKTVLAALKPILEDPNIGKIGQNLKYDYTVFKNHGIHLQGLIFDTMLESYLLNSVGAKHNLGSLALKYLGRQTIAYEDVVGKGSKLLRFDEISVADAAPYAGEDAEVTYQLHETLYPLLAPSLKALLKTIEMPLVSVLAEIEYQGVLIDQALLNTQGMRLK